MVIDVIDNAKRYHALHPAFKQAFSFLTQENLAGLKEGKYRIKGEKIFALVSNSCGRGKNGAKMEFHRKFIDIQCCLAGRDIIGWLPLADCSRISAKYDKAKDCGFFADPPRAWFALTPGKFAMFFPEDVHAPLSGEGEVRKVVAKVAV